MEENIAAVPFLLQYLNSLGRIEGVVQAMYGNTLGSGYVREHSRLVLVSSGVSLFCHENKCLNISLQISDF